MAENINLVGSFQDSITPKLKKLNRELSKTTKAFTKMGRSAGRATKLMAKPLAKVNTQLAAQKVSIDRGTKSWRAYSRAVAKASKANRRFKPVKGGMMAPRAPRGGGRRGGGGGGLGIGGVALGGMLGGLGAMGVLAGVDAIRAGVSGFVEAGKQAETDFLMMANTLSTLGNVDFESAKALSEKTIADLVKTAQALPGSTKDFITIAQQVMDESIIGFGSMEAALADIGKGADSFVGKFGLLAQAAGLNASVAAGDLAQLAANPMANQRTISLFKYNPALFKAYQENLAKFNGDYFKALNAAMSEVVSPELISNLRNTFSTSMEEFITNFSDPYVGLFGALRKVSITMSDGSKQTLTTMENLGLVMRQINDVIATIFGMNLSTDPLVSLNQFLYEVGYVFYSLNRDLQRLMSGELNLGDVLGELGSSFGTMLGEFTAGVINFITGIDYAALAAGLNAAIFDFFTALLSNIDVGQIGQMALNLIQGMFGSLAGFIIGSAAVVKFMGIWGTITSVIGTASTFISTTLIPILGSIGTFITGTVLPALAAVAVPVLAVVGAVLLVIAVVRNFGNILRLISGGFKLWFSTFKSQWANIFKFLIGGIQKLLGPLGGFLDGPLDAVTQMAEDAAREQKEALKEIGEAASGIAQQTREDFAAIGSAVGLGGNEAEATAPATPASPEAPEAPVPDTSNWLTPINEFFASVGEAFQQGWDALIANIKSWPGRWMQAIKVITTFWTTTVPQALQTAFDATVQTITQAFERVVSFFVEDIPFAIGFAVGQMVTSVTSFFTETIPAAFSSLGQMLSNAWASVTGFFQSIPGRIQAGFQAVVQGLLSAWEMVKAAFNAYVEFVQSLPQKIKDGVDKFFTWATSLPEKIKKSLVAAGNAIVNWVKGLPGRVLGALGRGFQAGQQNGSASYDGNTSRTMPLAKAIETEQKNKPPGSHLVIANSSETVIPAFKGHIPDGFTAPAAPAFEGHINVAAPAVPAFEGHINVAASAPAIDVAAPAVPAFEGHINVAAPATPAFDGYASAPAVNVPAPIVNVDVPAPVVNVTTPENTASDGQLTSINESVVSSGGKIDQQRVALGTLIQTAIQNLASYSQTNTAELAKVASTVDSSKTSIVTALNGLKSDVQAVDIVKSISIPMSLQTGNGPMGGPAPLNAAAATFGLQMTSGYRPGDEDSYHGIDRARDYAGPAAQMMAFAKFVASAYGSSLKELIYSPLGFSIKNGQVVPPYAVDTHYDHVHVAYGMGAGNPAFFQSQKDAVSWEKRVAPSNEMVKSVTTHTGEVGRGDVHVGGINITVNTESSMDGDEIANMVAGKVMDAVTTVTHGELFLS